MFTLEAKLTSGIRGFVESPATNSGGSDVSGKNDGSPLHVFTSGCGDLKYQQYTSNYSSSELGKLKNIKKYISASLNHRNYFTNFLQWKFMNLKT